MGIIESIIVMLFVGRTIENMTSGGPVSKAHTKKLVKSAFLNELDKSLEQDKRGNYDR